jgi:hypothetical protein
MHSRNPQRWELLTRDRRKKTKSLNLPWEFLFIVGCFRALRYCRGVVSVWMAVCSATIAVEMAPPYTSPGNYRLPDVAEPCCPGSVYQQPFVSFPPHSFVCRIARSVSHSDPPSESPATDATHAYRISSEPLDGTFVCSGVALWSRLQSSWQEIHTPTHTHTATVRRHTTILIQCHGRWYGNRVVPTPQRTFEHGALTPRGRA